jgi:tRNA-specific 2-thiouridylase
VGGTKKPLFVIATDVDKNIVYVGEGKDHPGLLRNVLYVNNDDVHWVRDDLKLFNGDNLEVFARIRYRQTLQKAYIHKFNDGLYVEFLNLQTAITEGQFVAWYIGEELVGSGVIS